MKGFVKPRPVVLAPKALVPKRNHISPPPNQFTHRLSRSMPYYFTGARRAKKPDGEFAEGTKVVLLVHDGGKYCRVADGQGLYVEVECGGLKKL